MRLGTGRSRRDRRVDWTIAELSGKLWVYRLLSCVQLGVSLPSAGHPPGFPLAFGPATVRGRRAFKVAAENLNGNGRIQLPLRSSDGSAVVPVASGPARVPGGAVADPRSLGMVSMRKALAGALIRLAHRIYRPRVTVDRNVNFHIDTSKLNEHLQHWREQQDRPNLHWG